MLRGLDAPGQLLRQDLRPVLGKLYRAIAHPCAEARADAQADASRARAQHESCRWNTQCFSM